MERICFYNKQMVKRCISGKGKLPRILAVLLLVCGVYYYASNWSRNHVLKKSNFLAPEKMDTFLLDTPGCQIPNLDPYDNSVIHLIEKMPPYKCPGKVLLSTGRNNVITFNKDVLKNYYRVKPENLSCTYQSVIRQHEPKNGVPREIYITLGNRKPLNFRTSISEEFIVVHCQVGRENITEFVPLIPLKFEEEKKKAEKNAYSPNELNVLLLQVDSTSKLNFIRHFPKTRLFLESILPSFEMKGYNKVADNTFPNLTPLLTGHFVEYYWNESLKDKMFFDDLDFIWKHYSKKGYRTFFAEDSPHTGTFNYLKRGFRNPPTDYNFRPLALAIEESGLKKHYCVGSQIDADIIFNYLKDFIREMESRPFFAFAIISTMTHDYINNAGYADEPTFKVLLDLWKMGTFNKTALFIFSDHGLRFGKIRETYIGKFEERLPFMYIHLPDWYLERHPDFANSLKINQNRLITLFDVHATLIHMLNKTENKITQDNMKKDIEPKGFSLFNEISAYRTCEEANILQHWCSCQEYQYVSPSDKKAVKSAIAVIDYLNLQLKPYEEKCAVLKLKSISDARYGQANDVVLKLVDHKIFYGNKVDTIRDYLITFEAMPGGGIFEGTVRYYVNEEKFIVLGVSRINLYGSISQCIESQELRKYCVCN